MFKLKILFAAFFLLTLLQVMPPVHRVGKSMVLAKEPELQSSFEESNSQIFNLGDVSTGDAVISVFSTTNQNLFSNFKTKLLEAAVQLFSAKSNLFISLTSGFSSLAYRVDEIPIYLQVRNFLL